MSESEHEANSVDPDSIDDGDVTDVLPDDLNVSEHVGPYLFPNNNRRRVPAVLYVVTAVGVVVWWLLSSTNTLVNQGSFVAAIGLFVFAVYSFFAGWDLKVDENDALLEATRTVGFPVGHASAQMGWRGWLSRPTWRILLYSNEAQPERRGLVLVDGVDGEVLDAIIEDNPEDWSAYNGSPANPSSG